MNQPRVRSRFVRRSNAFHRAEVSKFFASLVASRVDVSGTERARVCRQRGPPHETKTLFRRNGTLCAFY